MPCEFSGRRVLLRSVSAVTLFAGLGTAIGVADSSAVATKRRCRLGTDHDPAIVVDALLVVAAPISTMAATAMQAETERIWDRHGVRIRWRGHGYDAADSRASVDVLVAADPRKCGDMPPAGRNTLGCFRLTGVGDSRPVITVFPQHAQRLAGALGAHLCGHRCLDAWLERLQGALLGRALAHEIGHYLLGPEHTSDGLMRAEFSPRDVLAGDLKAISLTGSQVQRLSTWRLDRQRTVTQTAGGERVRSR